MPMVVVGDAIAIALRRAVFLVRTESLSVLDRLDARWSS